MALEPHDIVKLLALRKSHPEGRTALILGDCGFPFSRACLADAAGDATLRRDEGPAALGDVAAALGFDRLDTIDLFGTPTIRFDLQSAAVPVDLRAQYDWVIDAGTLYCCFNVSRVMQNVLEMLKPSGLTFHLAGLVGYLGRGYYSLSPMFFHDFYRQNGFEILEMGVRLRPRSNGFRWYHAGLAGRVLRRLGHGPREHGWNAIGLNDSYVAAASATEISFTTSQSSHEPNVLPNNAMIMCVARRRSVAPFRDAVPGYFAG
ncbi:MAG TPA: hypothetical protein VG871_17460 [Vicinamibacterales bacterium]|nr:hypothetical protein [Vicinamibacterales bacterium]